LRFTIAIHLRDINKTIQAALSEGRAGDWHVLNMRLSSLSGKIDRNGKLENLNDRATQLARLRRDTENLYISILSPEEMSASAHENEHHIQNTELESFDNKIIQSTENPAVQKPAEKIAHNPEAKTDLHDVLKLCPQINNYARETIKDWRNFLLTAHFVSSMLGISKSAWNDACEVMGELNTAIVIAVILEKIDTIHSSGGYLRKLTVKAQCGQFNVQPMLQALRKTHH
jgi:replication initiation protein RepC